MAPKVGELYHVPLSNPFVAAVKGRLAAHASLAAEYAAAAERYVAFRDGLDGPLPGDPAAGGMPTHVKCLHVQLAHFLATGDNPVGARAYGELAPMPCPGPRVGEDVLAAAYTPLPTPAAIASAWEAPAPPDQRPRPTHRRVRA